MKKRLLFMAAIGASMSMLAQPINRKALIEEFTSATCGPCASQNPSFNALIGPNRDVKVVPVKYQVPIPSAGDPMYAQNMPESDARRSYYGVSSAPMTRMNGFTPDNNNTTGGNWTGYAGGPYGYTQAVLDAEFNNLTSFSLVLDHWVSEDLDTVYATITITNVDTVAVNNANLILRAALLEETITFATAPGSNGETTFEEVMRKMIPNATGTAVTATWVPGQSEVISIEAPIPNYIYDYTELSMSAWLQDDATKEVLQADYNDPAAVQGNDAALVIDDLGGAGYCETELTPVLEISNDGTMTFSSVDIDIVNNGSVLSSVTWTGSLAPGASSLYTLPSAINLDAGVNELEFRITSVDNGPDISNSNNVDGEEVISAQVGIAPPVTEDFEGETVGASPQDLYKLEGPNQWPVVLNQSWAPWITTPVGAYANSAQSLWFALGYSSNPIGGVWSVITDNYDFSNSAAPSLSFSYAYAQLASGENSVFSVDISTDCGDTWTNEWSESGNDLVTAGVNGTNIVIPTSEQWEDVEIDLSSYRGESQVMVKFQVVKDGANGLFIDDISVLGPPSDTSTTVIDGETVYIIDGDTFELVNGNYYPLTIADVDGVNVTVFPNPANDFVTVTGVNGLATVMIYDAMGRMVSNTTLNNNVLSISELKAGVYTLVIENNGTVVNERITVIH